MVLTLFVSIRILDAFYDPEAKSLDTEINITNKGRGWHRTESAFMLLTQQPPV